MRFQRLASRAVVVLVAFAALTGGVTASAEPFHRPVIAPARVVAWSLPVPRLDQGSRDTCGIFAVFQQVNMLPGRKITQALADRMSDEVQATTVSAVYSDDDAIRDVLARHGYSVTYRTLTGPDSVLAALRAGPVVVALPFFDGMYDTTATGRWQPTGTFQWISHGFVARGYDPLTGRILMVQQWGTWWGVDGTMWMTVADFRAAWATHPSFAYATVWARA